MRASSHFLSYIIAGCQSSESRVLIKNSIECQWIKTLLLPLLLLLKGVGGRGTRLLATTAHIPAHTATFEEGVDGRE